MSCSSPGFIVAALARSGRPAAGPAGAPPGAGSQSTATPSSSFVARARSASIGSRRAWSRASYDRQRIWTCAFETATSRSSGSAASVAATISGVAAIARA